MLYIHVPFCRSFCTYCDFYSEIACRGRDGAAVGAYADGLCAEVATRRDEIEAASGLNTLYIGGGTPSVLPLSVLGHIVEAAGVPSPVEFTVEVNPEDIVEKGSGYVQGLLDLGVDRVSMGVQSMSDAVLRRMNRRHSADGAKRAFAMLRDAGVRNISVDVIFGGLGVSLPVLDDTVSELLALGPDHMSAYQLGIEEGSELGRMLREGRYTETTDDECREQYDLLCSRLASAGFEHYEISNWARPGRRAVHNSAYWKRLPYVGLGPAAHSFDGSRRSWNSCALSGWTREYEDITPEQAREEAVMLGLRTSDGIDPSLCDSAAVERLLSEGLLCRCGDSVCGRDRIRIPEPEFFVSDSIIEALA